MFLFVIVLASRTNCDTSGYLSLVSNCFHAISELIFAPFNQISSFQRSALTFWFLWATDSHPCNVIYSIYVSGLSSRLDYNFALNVLRPGLISILDMQRVAEKRSGRDGWKQGKKVIDQALLKGACSSVLGYQYTNDDQRLG